MNLDDPQERSISAGEYVLGTLDRDQRASFDRALPGDVSLQAEVYAWQDKLLGLALKIAPLQPRVGSWQAIEQRLPIGRPLPEAGLPAARAAANDSFWQRLQRWPTSGVVAIAAALMLASLLVLRSPAPADSPRYLAVLQSPTDQSAGWVVEATAGGSLRLVPIAGATPPPAGKALQFWTKAEGAAGPTSLGLVKAGQVTELPVSSLPTLEARQLFELTIEPEGGSPIGRPTGPIVFVGKMVRL